MIQIGEGAWINPRYVVAAVLHEDDGVRTLTLTLDGAAGVPERYPDITGLWWVAHVMQELGLKAREEEQPK